MTKINKDLSCNFEINHGQKKSIEVRKKVNELYFKYGQSKVKIMETEGVSKPFVLRWTKSPGQDFEQDQRGWPKGKPRHYNEQTSKTVIGIHRRLQEDPHCFYTGATAVRQEWRKGYFEAPAPSLRTIGRIMKAHGLTQERKGRNKGAAAYLCYPEHTIYSGLGGRVLEADFIGKKYITGRTAPVNFIGFSFKKEPRLRYYKRIDSQKSMEFIKETESFFETFEKPDFIKVDNDAAMIGSVSGKRNLSATMIFLLANQVVPIFAVPRKPFSQASIEGNNSVFSRLFWNKNDFKNLEEIDQKLDWFNQSSISYTEYRRPDNTSTVSRKEFIPEVIFIRQVREENGIGYIDVLNERLPIQPEYINYFVLARWTLNDQALKVYFEKEKISHQIKSFPFLINQESLKKLKGKGKLLFGT